MGDRRRRRCDILMFDFLRVSFRIGWRIRSWLNLVSACCLMCRGMRNWRYAHDICVLYWAIALGPTKGAVVVFLFHVCVIDTWCSYVRPWQCFINTWNGFSRSSSNSKLLLFHCGGRQQKQVCWNNWKLISWFAHSMFFDGYVICTQSECVFAEFRREIRSLQHHGDASYGYIQFLECGWIFL